MKPVDTSIDLKKWANDLYEIHLPRWQELPDLDLYKDQVISQIARNLAFFASEETAITPSMINNYVKWKIIPAPDRRKLYGRPQLAGLMIVSLLKSVLPIAEIHSGMAYQAAIYGQQKAYDDFCCCFEDAARTAASCITADVPAAVGPKMNPENTAVRSACLSFLFQLSARRQIAFQQQLLDAGEQR